MFPRFFLFSALVLALFGSGCVIRAVDTEEFCTDPALVVFNDDNGGSADEHAKLPLDLAARVAEFEQSNSIHITKLSFKSATVRAVAGITSFDQLELIRAELTSGVDAALPPVLFIDYVRPADGAGGTELVINSAASDANLYSYLATGPAVLSVDARAVVPSGQWAVEVELCFNASVKLKTTH